MAALPDYYEILQVHPAAEPEVIQAAYRRLSLKYHPDVNASPDAAQRMAQLNQAYAILGDAERRKTYDRQRGGGLRSNPTGRATPALLVTPTELALGQVVLGQSRTFTLRVSNAGSGRLSGMVLSKVSWLRATPAEFNDNELEVLVRFQPSAIQSYRSPNALEIFSNGGRVVIAVRGEGVREEARVSSTRSSPPPPPPPRPDTVREREFAARVMRRPSYQVAKPAWQRVQIPFSAWIALGTIISSVVWFQIAPPLAVLPLGLGLWLAWNRARQNAAPTPVRATPTQAKSKTQQSAFGRCLACGSAHNTAISQKCPRCGGSVCPSCGACACRPGRSR